MENFSRVDDLLVKARDPNSAALIHNNRRYRYSDLQQGMIDIAGTLVSLNLYTDKIIVLLGNRPEAVMAIMGISYAGGTFIPLPNTIRAHRLTEIINDSGATCILTDESFYPIINALGETPTLRATLSVDSIAGFDYTVARSIPAYPAALMYTSGTTGKAKGVICPHQKMMYAVENINAYLCHRRTDLVATPLPLSHGYGLYQVLTLLAAGGCVMLEDNFAYPQQTLERIKRYHATGFACVPSMIAMMQKIDGWEDYLQDLEYITTAGAALPPATFRMLQDRFPRTTIMPMYGQAECVRALAYTHVDQNKYPDRESCGTPIPDTTTMLLDDRGNITIYGEGELVIDSNHVMDGYWNNPKETAKTFKQGHLYTGDRFRIDHNGMHFFIGRMDDLVKIKGERVSPQELDNALLEIPEVDEAVSFAVEDDVWGHQLVVYVSSTNYELTPAFIKRHCKRHLEPFLMPREVIVVKEVPKTDNGKYSRKELKEKYLEGRDQ